ncbi:DMT family transporter, partial [Streptomyces sp. URMC 123]|uniref:DMT family transporter n=1 Tax=Streptomyces sp. URMC 123 TaxID=3423403 RepID=UPI003F1E1B49
MSPLALSVALALLSAVAYAAAAVVQERLAAGSAPGWAPLLRQGRWWASVALNGAGALLHVMALGWGPLSVVQPLGVLTVVFALPMAAVWVKRPVSRAGRWGAVLVTAGLAGMLLLTGSGESRPLTGAEQLAVAVGTLGVLTGAGVTARWGRPTARAVALACASGVSFGVASVFVKAVVDDWTITSAAAWRGAALLAELPLLVAVAVLAVTGLATSQASYRGAGLTAPLATLTVVNPVIASLIGLALLDEGIRYGLGGALLVLAAAVVTVLGLLTLIRETAAARGRARTVPRAGGGPRRRERAPEAPRDAEAVADALVH